MGGINYKFIPELSTVHQVLGIVLNVMRCDYDVM